MRTSFKKLTSIVLAMLMILSVFSVVGLTASAAETGKTMTGDDVDFTPTTVHSELSGQDEYKFWITNNKGWSTVKVYAYNDGGDVTSAWPGWDMTEKVQNGYGEQVVAIYIPTSATGCVINDGGTNQTENITDFTKNYWVTDETTTGDFNQPVYKVAAWDDTPVPTGDDPIPTGEEFIPGENTVYLKPGEVSGDWAVWSFSGGAEGEFVSGSPVADNCIFVNTSDGGWTGRVGQTAAQYTTNNGVFVLDGSAEPGDDGFGTPIEVYGGDWGESIEPTEPDTTEPDTTEPDPTEPDSSEPDTSVPDTVPEPDTNETTTPVEETTAPVTSGDVEEGPFTAVIKLNGAEIKKQEVAGDTLKVTYNLTAPEALVDGQAALTYNKDKLTLESWEFPIVDSSVIDNLDEGLFNFSSVKKPYDFTNGGALVVCNFKVKDGAQGEATINLTIEELDSADTVYAANSQIPAEGQSIIDSMKNGIGVDGGVPVTEPTTDVQETTQPTEPTTDAPTQAPTTAPSTQAPTVAPTTQAPTQAPTAAPATQAPAKKTTVKKISSLKGTPNADSAVNFVKALKNDKDPSGSKFGALRANAKKVTKNSIKATWSKVSGAKKYIIMGNKCGSAYKKLKTVSSKSFTQKGLKKGTYYKYMILAVNSKNKVVSVSKTLHVATKGGKVGNYKSVKFTNASKYMQLGKGKKFTLKAKAVKADKKVKNHRAIKFESSNAKVVKVSSKGKLTGKKKGTATIYAYAQNGVYAKIKVKVK